MKTKMDSIAYASYCWLMESLGPDCIKIARNEICTECMIKDRCVVPCDGIIPSLKYWGEALFAVTAKLN